MLAVRGRHVALFHPPHIQAMNAAQGQPLSQHGWCLAALVFYPGRLITGDAVLWLILSATSDASTPLPVSTKLLCGRCETLLLRSMVFEINSRAFQGRISYSVSWFFITPRVLVSNTIAVPRHRFFGRIQ